MPNKKCSYNSSYYDKCVCKSSLVNCVYPRSGVGESCDGKYQSCQCPSSYKSCECVCANGATSCMLDGVTTCSECKSCCNSSSSDWCSVHDICHGDCCSDGTIDACDEQCGGSECSSSGGSDSGGYCRSGEGNAYALCSCGSHPRIDNYYVATSSTYYACDDGNTRDYTVEWLATPNEAECEARVSKLEADGYCHDYRFSGYPCDTVCD